MMSNEETQTPKRKPKAVNLLNRLQQAKPEFKPYRFNLASDLLDRLEHLQSRVGLSQEQINDALNFAVRKLLSQLEREAGMAQK